MPRAIRLTLQTGGGGGGGGGGAITATVRAADELLVLGRARVGLPRDRNQLHRRHAEVGWERGVPIVRRLGANQVGIIRGGLRLKVGMGVERGALEHGDALFFLLRSDGLQYSVAIVDEGEGEGDEANRAAGKRSADGDEAGQGQTRPAKLRRTEDEDEAWLEEQVAKVNAAPGILSLLPSGVRTNVQQIWSSFDPPELEDGIARFRQQQDSSSGEEKQRFTAMVDLMTACLERRRCQEANSRVAREGGHPPLAPATAATVRPPSKAFGSARPIFVCATGARGGKPRQAILGPLGTQFNFEFAGQPNLTSRKAEQKFVQQFVDAALRAVRQFGSRRSVYLVGQSFGSRAAVHVLCREDMRKQLPPEVCGVLAMGYPLVHASQHRERKLMELPPDARVLFLSGTADHFMDFGLLREYIATSPAAAGLEVCEVMGANHSVEGVPKKHGGQAQADEHMRRAIERFLAAGPGAPSVSEALSRQSAAASVRHSTTRPRVEAHDDEDDARAAAATAAAAVATANGSDGDDDDDDDELLFKGFDDFDPQQGLPNAAAATAAATRSASAGSNASSTASGSGVLVPRPRPADAKKLLLHRMQSGKYKELVKWGEGLPPPPTLAQGAAPTIMLINRRLRGAAPGTGPLGSAAYPETQIPALGFGCHQLTKSESKVAIPEALRLGYRLIDTAPGYGNRPKGSHRGDNEALVGDAISSALGGQSGGRPGLSRAELFVTTKLNNRDQGYDNAMAAVQESLSRLGLDYIDLLLVHSPCPFNHGMPYGKHLTHHLHHTTIRNSLA
jgi:hypothetical protein